MDARHTDDLTARADLYLCLARAFATPRGEAAFDAMRDALADDLGDLADDLGLDAGAALAEFRDAMQRVDGPLHLLQIHSALFLVPPFAAFINAGQYLDGALNGGSVRAMEEAYALCGIERDDGFRDLSDHVSVQLEFVAWLYATQASAFAGAAGVARPPVEPGQFLHAFALRWVDRFAADVGAATAGRELTANPYAALARVLRDAVAADAVAPEADPKALQRQRAIEQARAKAAARGIGADELAEIRRKLQARGLSTEHLVSPDPHALRPPARR